jgi:hypothetical protein
MSAEKLTLPPTFIKPHYNGAACFANIPQTVKYLLTGQAAPALPPELFGGLLQRYEQVILLFIDAFGWRFFEKYQDHPFLKAIARDGVVSKLTSQFPSTTAAHVTCIHTGLATGQSGIFEWQYYEPQLDALIAPLLFSFAGDSERETLKSTGIEPQRLYPANTIYPDLQQHGVSSYAFQHREIVRTTYSEAMFQGAQIKSYKSLAEALINLTFLMNQQRSPAYYFLYFGQIDSICHQYGPGSPQVEAEFDILLMLLDRWFLQKLKGKTKNTLLIVTADHGQIEIDPKTTIYLNLEPRFAGIERYLKTNRAGKLLAPAGSARDMFLYIKDGYLAEAQAFLSQGLAGKAEVYRVRQLVEQGFFGPPPLAPAFLARAGDLVILPYDHETVWWYEKDRFEQRLYGHHGGLTRQEMEIPFLLYDFSV